MQEKSEEEDINLPVKQDSALIPPNEHSTMEVWNCELCNTGLYYNDSDTKY